MKSEKTTHTSTRNACRLCTPFGACLAFRGVEGAMPFIHGSQGCATYIRRYIIGHFREPMDIACSNFTEHSAVFGGKENLQRGLQNVARQYQPELIGVATTCLSETIGDDMNLYLHSIHQEWSEDCRPVIVPVSTPSYQGSHSQGFFRALRALVTTLAETGPQQDHINLFMNMISSEDIRHLRDITEAFGLTATLLPDYSDTLDGQIWEQYERLPSGGTPVQAIRACGTACHSVELSVTSADNDSAGQWLQENRGIGVTRLPLPVGIKACDRFMETLANLSGRDVPERLAQQRGRLIDAYVDGHKYLYGKRAILYGEEDLVVAVAGFMAEIGIIPILCATGGGERDRFTQAITGVTSSLNEDIQIMANVDFAQIEEAAETLSPDLLIGNSNGAKLARKLNVPLVRVGMPVHDRMGAARIQILGYLGTQQLYDRICNALIEVKQESSPVGYTHM